MSSQNQIVRTNYHTHMYLCKHANGTVEDYVKEAINNNFTDIGMSDHAPWDMLHDRSVRMEVSDYPIYLKELNNSIEKYKDQINIYKGLEIEYFKNQDQTYKRLLEDVDYLTLGQHYIEMNNSLISVYRIKSIQELTIYKDTIIEAMRKKYFKFISHPDIFLFSQKNLSKEVLQLCEEIILAAKEENVLLEINANGFRKGSFMVDGEERFKYPRQEFWELVKKHDVSCLISSDAHDPKLLMDWAVEHAVKFSKALNLRVVEELSFN